MTNKKNTRKREYLLTFNNPSDHGFTREKLLDICRRLEPLYFCISDEIGNENQTPHSHIYLNFKNARYFNSIRKAFDEVPHIDSCYGTPSENRDYVFKEGKWIDDPKGETNLRDTHYEEGELPEDNQGKRNDLSMIRDLVKEGISTYDIIDNHPQFLFRRNDIDNLRALHKTEEYKNKFREVKVIYIFGTTASGKTRYVMDKFGYTNVYRVSDYKNPFDEYEYQDVILFEEFRGQISISQMLELLDGYPCTLPCRYHNKTACYTKVYICTNIPLQKQYAEIGIDKETFDAFIRRLYAVMEFDGRGDVYVYTEKQDFMPRQNVHEPRGYMTLEEFEAFEQAQELSQTFSK